MPQDTISTGSAHARHALARAWHSKGKLDAAIAGYRDALALDPSHLPSAILLGALLESQLRLNEALQIYRESLQYNPNDARLHKQFVNVLLMQDGPDAIFQHYRLARRDSKELNLHPAAILCCIPVRNERARLPYFLAYYRAKGAGAFIAVDNGSTDGSLEYLLEQPDVYLWQSDLSFNKANFGAAWLEPILRTHVQDHWVVIMDADELLYYPDCERRSLVDLCRTLDAKGKRAFSAIVLDTYSDRPIRDTHYTPGQSFEEVCPFFDRRFYHEAADRSGPFQNQTSYYGGVRQRVLGEGRCILSKVPLLRYRDDCILAGGQHGTNLPPEQVAAESGCVLHVKYFSSFSDQVNRELERKEHYAGAERYEYYERCLRDQPALSLYDPAHSIKLEDSRQLVRLGVMRDDPAPDPAAIVFPAIDPVPSGTHRPFWSVTLSVFRRTCYLEGALRSVLAQAPGPEDMQIEVVMDGPHDPIETAIEDLVRSVAGARVNIYRHPDRAGHPEIFNVCVRRTRGRWVHILHDDDTVAPDFYATLRQAIEQSPDIGAAFCRNNFIDEEGRNIGLAPLERETPGVIGDWLDRIGSSCRLQTPSIVVRRETYERLGGYCPRARSAFDWEMWQRIAVHYPVWYEPAPLASFRRSRTSESARVGSSGERIADSRAVIDIASTYLPAEKAAAISRRARDFHAGFAYELARKQMDSGDLDAAVANLRQGILCSRSNEATHKLLGLLSEIQPPKA